MCVLSRTQLLVTLWIIVRQAPLSMGFSRQEYWSGLPFPPPGGLPDPGTEPASPGSPALAGGFFTSSATWEAPGMRVFRNPEPSDWAEQKQTSSAVQCHLLLRP